MGLETATYISDLVPSNPPWTDKRRQGDDHLRLIKKALKNTFPQISNAVEISEEELNYLSGTTNNVQDQLDGKLATNALDGYAELDRYQEWSRTQHILPINQGSKTGIVNLDATLSTCQIITLAGDITLKVQSPHEGQEVVIKLVQGPGGPHTVTWNAQFKFPFGVKPILSTTAGAIDVFAGKAIDGDVIGTVLNDCK